MNDLDAIIEVVDDVSNVEKLDNETLSHAFALSMDLMDIFSDEIYRRRIENLRTRLNVPGGALNEY